MRSSDESCLQFVFFGPYQLHVGGNILHLSSLSATRGEGGNHGRYALEQQVGSHLAVIHH